MSDLLEAYEGVYVSSKEILRNKQKHLYINMLDLLTRATKATISSNKDLISDEYVKFWFMDIIPLIFDEDKSIQDNAISALDTALQCIDPSRVHDLPEWPGIKTSITEHYSVKLHEMRQISNSNWYRAWSLLIRILNKDILKGAVVINTFLSIVELGFRSSDYKTRAEAFICWKVLVQIFAKNNEIFAPKRIKLICIPLKSSQSKTLETAVNKLKVWWYFLCKLNTKIVEYHDIAFEPFLLFCFGCPEKNQAIAQCKTYPIVKKMAIATLIEMLGPSTRESQCLLETTDLERPETPLITTALMIKCGKAILNASFEAMLMIAEKNPERNKCFDALWRNLLEQISKTNNIELYLEYCRHVRRLVELETIKDDKVSQHYFSYIIAALGTDKMFPFEHDGTANDPQALCRVISEITNLLRNKKIDCSIQVSEAVINNIYDIRKLKNSNKYWDVQRLLIEAVMQAKELDFYLKMIIWEKISGYLTDYLNERLFEFRIEQNAVVVNNWLFWLIETCDINDKINESFLDCWKKLSLAASKAEGKCNFTRAISGRFKDLLDKKSQLQILPDILSSIIDSLEVEYDKSSKPVEVYELISHLLNNAYIQLNGKETVVAATTRHINKLQENQILEGFEDFRVITATLISHSGSLTKHIFEEFKKTLSDKLKTNKAKDKKLLKEFKDLFKNNSNPFVIIPTSWSFNPDKLTEHQKEKMKEKTYIPALYNDISHDLSHSQDIIKPWTPKKIVIAKGKNSEEIVIENKIVNNDEKLVCNENQEVIENDCTNIPLDKSDETDKSKENVDPSGETSNREEGNININKSVISERPKESEKNDKTVIPKDFEELLKKYNIQVEDEKKKLLLLKQLKTIEIDTVEGNTFITGAAKNLRSTRSSRQINKSISGENSRRSERNKEEKESKTRIPKKRFTRKSLIFKGNEDEKTANILAKDKQEGEEQENKDRVSGDDSSDEIIGASQEPSQSVLKRKMFLNNNINSPYSKKRSLNLIKSPDVIENKSETCSENIHLRNAPAMRHTENVDVRPVQDTWSPLEDPRITLNEKEEKTEDSRSPKRKSEKEEEEEENPEDSKRSPRNNKIMSEKEEEKCPSLSDKTSPKQNIYEFSEEPLETFSKDFDCKKTITQKCSSPRLRKSPCKPRFESENEVVHNSASQLRLTKEDNSSIINAQQCDNAKLPSMETETNDTNIVNTEIKETCTAGTENQKLQNPLNESISASSDLTNGPYTIDSPYNALKICPMANSTNIEITDVEALGDVSHSDEYDKITKSTSPKKILRPCSSSPSSPPDRKQTMNNESPIVKPKQMPQLTGRGAKLINMIRNNKLEVVPKVPMNGLMTANIEKKISPQKWSQKQEMQQNSPEKGEQTALQQPVRKDLLVFSKILPSPNASPSVSILKRKFRQDSFDDLDSTANKRKRVSFHDPPVSVTKEYVKHVDEERYSTPTSKRCLIPEKSSTSQLQSSKQNFKRKSRVDSIIEIAKFTETSTPVAEADLNHLAKDHSSLNMNSLKWNSTDNAEQGDDANLMSSPSLYFPDESSIFSFIFEKYQFEDILEKYTASGKILSGKSCKAIIKEVSAAMCQEPKLKANVLEMLSEKHPKEFLDHAIQENLSAVVCDRLNTASVIEYVSEKAKINTGMRSALLDQIPNILGDKSNTEKYEFLTSLLQSQQLSQDQVVECIDLIMHRHKECRQNQSNDP